VTSAVSREDVEDELYRAGIRSQYIKAHLMRIIEMYARKFPAPPEEAFPLDPADFLGYKYKCRECSERKYIGFFPSYKKLNPKSPVPCTECLEKRNQK
jgi:hypothetical protein